MLKNKKQHIFNSGLIFFGLLGFIVSLLGELTNLGQYQSAPPHAWEKFDQKLMIETPDIIALQNKIDFSLTHRARKKC